MNTKKFLLLGIFCTLLALLYPTITKASNLMGNVLTTDKENRDKIAEALASAIAQMPELASLEGNQFELGYLKLDGNYGVLNALQWPQTINENSEVVMPYVVLGIAQNKGDEWKVYLEGSTEFANLIPAVPETLLSLKAKDILTRSEQNKLNPPQNLTGYHFPGLPWTVGETWTYNQDLHGVVSNAVDLGTPNGESSIVRSVDEGIVVYATQTCIAFKRGDNVYHGYQHITSTDIAQWAVGDTVDYQGIIGHTTTQGGCSGTSNGHHVHFWIYDQATAGNNKNFDPIASSFDGWVLWRLHDYSEAQNPPPSSPPSSYPVVGYDYPFIKDGLVICPNGGSTKDANGNEMCEGHTILFTGSTLPQPPQTGDCPSGVAVGASAYTELGGISAEYVRDRICEAYLRNAQFLGEPEDVGSGVNVHWWNTDNGAIRYQVQDIQSNAYPNAHAIIIFNPMLRTAFVIRNGIWEYYKDNQSINNPDLGGPVSDEYKISDNEYVQFFLKGSIKWTPTGSTITNYNDLSWWDTQTFFRDGPEVHQFYKSIEGLGNEGVSNGCYTDEEDNIFFCPERPITRAEIAMLLARVLYGANNNSLPYPDNPKFADSEDNSYGRAVETLALDNIVFGYEDENGQQIFGYDEFATRGQVIAMVVRALNVPMPPEPLPSMPIDISGHTFENEIKKAIFYGVAHGYSGNKFFPDQFATRGMTAKFLCRAFLKSCDDTRSDLLRNSSLPVAAPGMQVNTRELENGTIYLSKVSLQNPYVDMELAYNHTGNNFFQRLNIFKLIAFYSTANQGSYDDPFFAPFVAVNGTGFECSGELDPFSALWIKEINFFDEGDNRAFFGYNSLGTSSNIYDPEMFTDTVSILDFALGYDRIFIESGEYKFPNGNNHLDIDDKTAIGVSSDGKNVILATAPASLPIDVFAQNLIDLGVYRAIMLDGGDSSQFYSYGRMGTMDNGFSKPVCFGDGGITGLGYLRYRKIINSVVAYNNFPIVRQSNIDLTGTFHYGLTGGVLTVGEGTFSTSVNTSSLSSQPVILQYASQPMTVTFPLQNIGSFHDIKTLYQDGSVAEPQRPYTVTLVYSQRDLPPNTSEEDLGLYYWNGSAWELEPTSSVDTVEHVVTATPMRMGLWAVLIANTPLGAGNTIWQDSNGNGIQDNGEPGIPDVYVSLYSADGERMAMTQTDADGRYSFNETNVLGGLRPLQNYEIRLDYPFDYTTDGALAGLSLTTANQGSDDLDSDATYNDGNYPTIAFTAGAANTTNDTLDIGLVVNDCDGNITGSILADNAHATITNHSSSVCPVLLASYRKFDAEIDNQQLFDWQTAVLQPGQTVTLHVDLPACAAQIDLAWGTLLYDLEGVRYDGRLIAYRHVGGTNYCGTYVCPNTITGLSGITEGQVATGVLYIEALVDGPTPDRVAFDLVDSNGSHLNRIEKIAPYFFMGDTDGQPNGWHSSDGWPGAYSLTATVYDAENRFACGSVTVNFTIGNAIAGTVKAAEQGLANVTVRLVGAGANGVFDTPAGGARQGDDTLTTTVTKSGGAYTFMELNGDGYRVEVDAATLPAGVTMNTVLREVSLPEGQVIADIDFVGERSAYFIYVPLTFEGSRP